MCFNCSFCRHATDVFCRHRKDHCRVDDKDVPNLTENKTKKRRSKSVTFADSKGLALTSTLVFTKDNLSPPVRRRSTPGWRTTKVKDDKERMDPREPAQLLNFTCNTSYEEFLNKVNNSTNVCLESIVCYTFGMYGRIWTKNIAYEKYVAVRYTFDAWRTWKEATATFIAGASTDSIDSFFFHIRPPNTNTDRRKVELAIRYQACGNEYWDNNFGDNYRLVYYKTKPMDTMNLPAFSAWPDRNM